MKNQLFLLSFLVFIIAACQPQKNIPEIYDLRCEYVKNPIGIDTQQPRLSWKIKNKTRGTCQSAYRILVATGNDLLNNNTSNLWDSGKVESDQSIHVVYNGKPLKSGIKVYWKVQIWNEEGKVSSWSQISDLEMGFLNENDWQSKWIGSSISKSGKEWDLPSPYFRKEVSIQKKVKKARAYISGLGYYELYINGKKVGNHVLSPNQTNYDRRDLEKWDEPRVGNMNTTVLYEVFDISENLNKGENVLGVVLGNGWYIQADRPLERGLWYDTPRFIAQFEIEYEDGSKERIKSDESWMTAASPILYNGLHSGEIYDARLEQIGWNKPGFNDSCWEQAIVVRTPGGKLKSQLAPPDRITKTIKPVSVSEPEKGIYRFDMGQMLSGWVRLNISGEKGTKIKLRFIEELGPTYGQTDTYILKGQGTEIWEPRFTWHAFRYVDVIGAQSALTLENIEGRVVNTDVEAAGSFECSNELLNQIHTNYQWTQLGNMHGGIPSDCPHRERRGYTGDGQISARAAIYNFDMSLFYTKWLDDISDAQNHVTGYVPNTAPYQDGGGGTAWGAAYVIIPWNMYLYYGDKQILYKHYDGMKHWIKYMENSLDEKGILADQGLGEWVPPALVELPPDFVNTCYYFHCCGLMMRISEVLGKEEDRLYFKKLAGKAKQDINQIYFNDESGNYSIGRQGANIIPLGFGIVESKNKNRVFESLIRNTLEENQGHFDTGILGTPLLLEVLTELGRIDVAYTLMTQRDFPGFGYMIDQGATTIWETWQGEASHSHPMFGSVCKWFYQHIGGIGPSTDQPGFKHSVIKPYPINRLKFANTSYQSMYGMIKTDWQLKNDDFYLETTIPANTTATVYLLAKNIESITESGKKIAGNPYIRFIGMKPPFAKFEVQSGTYTFKSDDVSGLLKKPVLSAPVISPGDTLASLGDSVRVNIISDISETEVRYTLDDTDPDEHSYLFDAPFSVTQPTTIRAKVFEKDSTPGIEKKITIDFIDPKNNGINFKYYEGVWQKLPDFNKQEIVKRGIVYALGLDQINPNQDEFGLVFTSNMMIETEGEYEFYLMSNDGSKLFIDKHLIINFDGLHGADSEKKGKIFLTKGMHPVKLEYFQAGGGLFLKLHYSGPGIEKQEIPATVFFKTDN
ncbi:family 78 glycoside hydrolase catalytic domain [Draconibacterium sp.]|nr:family 78 glycoside hydrolase catalytic domain [Draconibacterium sp.]